MRDRLTFRAGLLAAGIMLAGAGVFADASPVAAQGLIFDWGDNDKTVDSGKAHVRFNGGGKPGDIIVSFGDRKLYHIVAPGEADTYPIAIPREQSRWEGVTSVSMKRENPSWTPTAHMLAENPKLPRWVPGGHPMNPLGNRAMYLGSSDYRIHGTDAPWTIGTPASKGCVRMFNKDVADLYPRVKVGSKVTVTWQKFDGKTLAMTGHEPAKGIVEPDAKTGKATLASFTPENAADEPANKSKKPVENDDEAQASQAAAAPAQQVSPQEEPVGRKRRPKPRLPDTAEQPAEGKEAASNVAAVDATKPELFDAETGKSASDKSETGKTAPKNAAKSAGKSDEAKVEPAAEQSATRPHRRKAVSHAKAVEQAVETGSIPQPAAAVASAAPATAATAEMPAARKASAGKSGSSKNDESLALAERAMAAAERAAAAAERAAAAAERAVAAVKPQAAATPAGDGNASSSH